MTTRVGINGFGRIGRSFTRPSDTAGRDRPKALGRHELADDPQVGRDVRPSRGAVLRPKP